MFPSPTGNEVGLIRLRTSIICTVDSFPSPTGNEVDLISKWIPVSERLPEKFPFPMGNEVSLIKRLRAYGQH